MAAGHDSNPSTELATPTTPPPQPPSPHHMPRLGANQHAHPNRSPTSLAGKTLPAVTHLTHTWLAPHNTIHEGEGEGKDFPSHTAHPHACSLQEGIEAAALAAAGDGVALSVRGAGIARLKVHLARPGVEDMHLTRDRVAPENGAKIQL